MRPHLRVVGVHLNFDVLERLRSWVRNRTPTQLGNRHTVDEVVIRADAAATNRNQRRVALILLTVELRVAGSASLSARSRRSGMHSGPATAATPAPAGRARRRSMPSTCSISGDLPGDRHRFLERSELEPHVERDELLRPNRQTLRLVAFVSGDLTLQRVGARRRRPESRTRPTSLVVTLARDVGRLIRERHLHARNDAVGVLHGPANAAGELPRRVATPPTATARNAPMRPTRIPMAPPTCSGRTEVATPRCAHCICERSCFGGF